MVEGVIPPVSLFQSIQMTVSRGVSLLFVMLLVVSSSGLAAPTQSSTAHADFSPTDAVAQTTETTAANSSTPSNTSNLTARHIGPDLPQTDAEYAVVLSQYEAQIAARLIASSEAVQAQDLSSAEVQLSGNTTELLRQYQRVAADSPDTEDDLTAENLNLTVQQQRDLIATARDAQATYNQYQLAKARGNQTRARQLARQLLNRSATGNQTATELIERYQRLQNNTDINISTPVSGIQDAQSRLNELEQTVRAENFVTPNLTVTPPAARASPTTPLVVSGRLTANNTSLSNGTLALTVGDQTERTQTNATGNFTVSLRPTALSTGTQPAEIRYVPDPTSPYESVRTRFNVTIGSTTPTVDAQLNRSRVRFGDSITISGHVTANGTSLQDVSVRAQLNGRRIAQTKTVADGRFHLTTSIDATPPSGTQQLTLIISNDGAAVQQLRETRPLTIDSTPTDLRVRVQQLNQTTLQITGSLQTTNDTVLSDRRITLTPGAADPLIVQTDSLGEFNATIPVPASADRGGIPFLAREVPVEALFDASGGNLESATTTATVSYTPPAAQSARNLLLGTFAIAVALGGAVLWQRRSTDAFRPATGPADLDERQDSTSDAGGTGPAPTALLARADTALTADRPAEAIQLGYAALRSHYVATHELNSTLTHWELTRQLQESLPPAEHETLSEATTAYERIVYATRSDALDDSDARRLVYDIRDIVTNSK